MLLLILSYIAKNARSFKKICNIKTNFNSIRNISEKE